MKRLRYYFDRISDNKTTTYRYNDFVEGKPVQKELYDAECHTNFVGRCPENYEKRREPTFWHNGIAYALERTNKLALDRPTITISIPAHMLGITTLPSDFHVAPSGNETFVNPQRFAAHADYCLRAITPYFQEINAQYANRSRPDKDNGKFYMYAPGQTVLFRNAAYFAIQPAKDYEELRGNRIIVNPDIDPPADIFCLHVRMEVQLPYLKLDRAKTMLCKQMPAAAERFVREFDRDGLQAELELAAKQQMIREHLQTSDYCAFIANGSILPREKGSNLPAKNAVPFTSPAGCEIEIAGIRGMGVRRGVTVVTGGGYSGKSTVLNAISAGIYNHVAGDGRELCITCDTATTITAEDGRAVSNMNISPFIKWIPGGNPSEFSTSHASGSTSQGANIMEAVAFGSKLLLIDEDRSATNFMIRDATMKELIEKEPITPFTDRVRELAATGVSTILVIGGSGEYLAVADKVYMMDEFVMSDATERAKALKPTVGELPAPANWQNPRGAMPKFSAYPSGGTREKLSISDTGFIVIGDERIDIRSLHDIATPAQVNALAFMLRHLAKAEDGIGELEALALAMRGLTPKSTVGNTLPKIDIVAKIEELYAQISAEGLNLVDTGFFTAMDRFMDMPRRFELMAAVNRMRYVNSADC